MCRQRILKSGKKGFPKKQEIHSSTDNQLKEVSNDETSNKRNENISGPLKGENDPEKQLLYFFKDKKIYIEIINDNINSSSTFYEILLKYKIIQCKKLSKKIDYIIFKDGHLKTQKYAVLNNIKLVNPLWIDDKVKNHIFKDDKEYEIKTNFGDIMLIEKYEKSKKEEKVSIDEENLNKDYDHELEIEYDIPYANYIDKLRENDSQKLYDNEMSTIEKSFNPDSQTINEMKDNANNNNINNIQREKRKSPTTNNKNGISILDKGDNNNDLKEYSPFNKTNDLKDKKKNENKSTKNNKTKENKKNQKKIRNSKSVEHNNSQLINNSQKNSNKKKKNNDDGEKNYVLELDKNNSKVLSLVKNEETKSTYEKINIMTYKLEEKEIQSLKLLHNFEYKGNINNNEKDKKINNKLNIIILEKNKVIYDWKMYEFLLDKIIIVDFTSFLLEFINDDNSNNFNTNTVLEKINQISINREIYFFNKKMRMQKRSMMQSLKIVDIIISKEKNEETKQQNNFENKFFFIINKDIDENEKKVLQKLLKNYLKADIINTNNKRSRSNANKINLNLEKKTKKEILETIKENDDKKEIDDGEEIKNESNEIGKSKNMNTNRIDNNMPSNKTEDIEINDFKENMNEKQKIEGTFLISKEKVNSIKFLKKIKYYKGVISHKYIYDSFLNGQLLDLNDKDIFEKYKL